MLIFSCYGQSRYQSLNLTWPRTHISRGLFPPEFENYFELFPTNMIGEEVVLHLYCLAILQVFPQDCYPLEDGRALIVANST